MLLFGGVGLGATFLARPSVAAGLAVFAAAMPLLTLPLGVAP